MAVDSMEHVDDTKTLMIRTDLWHGGAPGRAPSDLLLPPSVTGLRRTSAVLSVEAGQTGVAHRRDRLYLAADRELAKVWVGQWENSDGRVGYGWLYWVSVDELMLEPDDALLSLPGVSFQPPEAQVEKVYDKPVAPNQPSFRRILQRTLDDLAVAKTRRTTR